MKEQTKEVAVLLPCPFCGGPAVNHYVRDGRQVSCKTCRASGPPEYHGPSDSTERANAAWNRRTPQPPPEQAGSVLKIERRPLLVSGMLARTPEGLTILLDSESSQEEQTLALWHEVVHMVRDALGDEQDEEAVERDAKAIVKALSAAPAPKESP